MSVAVVIPARLASTRLPRKALRDIHGKPLIQWVYERSKASDYVDEVFVATPDKELEDVVVGFKGKIIRTGPAPTVLDRCSMAADVLEQMGFKVTVVVQGDEPTIYPEMIATALGPEGYGTCLIKKLRPEDDIHNPNMVKAIIDVNGYFSYLSRAAIPSRSPEKDYQEFVTPYYKQVCVMKFDTKFLSKFKDMPMGPWERTEGIDLLRYIENGYKVIKAIETKFDTQAVDTAEDLEKVREMLKCE